MSKQKIVLIRGLWSEPKAVRWIADNLEKATGYDVELFDFHDELVVSNSPKQYIDTITEKYDEQHGDDNPILLGHSHGAALALLLQAKFPVKKVILTNMCLQPFGIFRRVTTALTPGYEPHFEVKYPEEVSDRFHYFKDNFNLPRDFAHTLYTGIQADKTAETINKDVLMIQSGRDEFCSIKPNLKFFERISLPEETKLKLTQDSATKQLIWLPEAEHAVLEEKGIHPALYQEVAEFIKRR